MRRKTKTGQAKAIRRASATLGSARVAVGKAGVGLAVALLVSGLVLGRSASSASPEAAATKPPERSGMVRIPAGKFWYGCKEQVDLECDPDEQPGRSVDSPENQ